MTDTAEPYVDAGRAVSNSSLALIPGDRAAGGQQRQLRAHQPRPHRAAELAHLLRRLRRAALQRTGPDQHRERPPAQARVGVPVRRGRPAGGRDDIRVRGRADSRRRGHVRHRLGWLVLGPRRRDRPGAVAVPARDPVRRVAVLRQRQPRGRGGARQGVLRHAERAPGRAGRGRRQARVGQDLRRRAGRGERHGRAADHQGQGHRRQFRWGVRRARSPGRVRHRQRRASVALLHGAQAWRARLRDLAR